MEIEKKVTMPKAQHQRKVSKYPWGKLDVGDSFLIKMEYDPARQASIISCGAKWAKRNKRDWKFSSRKVDNGIRFWRIK